MAKFNEKMRAHVAASTDDRPAPVGSSGHVASPGNHPPTPLQRQADGRRRLEAARLIRLDRIIPDPDQPRTEFDPEALELLAASLKDRGQLQPIRVRWVESADRYVVVVGERRYRAAIRAGLESIACVVATGEATAEDILEDQLVENALRQDLRPIEQARAYQRLLAARGLSQRQLADRLQIGHASIARALGLLNLPGPIQAEVESGAIAPNTAYELSKVTDPGEQAELAREAAQGRLKRDDIKERTRTPRKGGGASAARRDARSWSTAAGPRVTVDQAGGLDPVAIAAALREVLEQVEREAGPRLFPEGSPDG